jgi:hypothetical protein
VKKTIGKGNFLLLFLIIIAVLACKTEPRSFEEEVRHHYNGERGFFYIKVPPALLTLVLRATDDREMHEFFKNARQVGVISFGDGFYESDRNDLVNNLEEMLNRHRYDDLITISEKDRKIILKIREQDGSVSELVAIVSQSDSPLLALTLSGEINIQTIASMASGFDYNKLLQLQSVGKRD